MCNWSRLRIQPFKQVNGRVWLRDAGLGAAVGAIVFFEFGFLVQLIEVDCVLDLGELLTHVLPGSFAAEAADSELFPIKLEFDGIAGRRHLNER